MAERILFQFPTTELDPQYMSNFLGAKLTKTEDLESTARFTLDYGTNAPLLLVRLHPLKRKIIVSTPVVINGSEYDRYSHAYYNVDSLRYVRWVNDQDEVFSDLAILQRGPDGLINQNGIISDKYHLTS